MSLKSIKWINLPMILLIINIILLSTSWAANEKFSHKNCQTGIFSTNTSCRAVKGQSIMTTAAKCFQECLENTNCKKALFISKIDEPIRRAKVFYPNEQVQSGFENREKRFANFDSQEKNSSKLIRVTLKPNIQIPLNDAVSPTTHAIEKDDQGFFSFLYIRFYDKNFRTRIGEFFSEIGKFLSENSVLNSKRYEFIKNLLNKYSVKFTRTSKISNKDNSDPNVKSDLSDMNLSEPVSPKDDQQPLVPENFEMKNPLKQSPQRDEDSRNLLDADESIHRNIKFNRKKRESRHYVYHPHTQKVRRKLVVHPTKHYIPTETYSVPFDSSPRETAENPGQTENNKLDLENFIKSLRGSSESHSFYGTKNGNYKGEIKLNYKMLQNQYSQNPSDDHIVLQNNARPQNDKYHDEQIQNKYSLEGLKKKRRTKRESNYAMKDMNRYENGYRQNQNYDYSNIHLRNLQPEVYNRQDEETIDRRSFFHPVHHHDDSHFEHHHPVYSSYPLYVNPYGDYHYSGLLGRSLNLRNPPIRIENNNKKHRKSKGRYLDSEYSEIEEEQKSKDSEKQSNPEDNRYDGNLVGSNIYAEDYTIIRDKLGNQVIRIRKPALLKKEIIELKYKLKFNNHKHRPKKDQEPSAEIRNNHHISYIDEDVEKIKQHHKSKQSQSVDDNNLSESPENEQYDTQTESYTEEISNPDSIKVDRIDLSKVDEKEDEYNKEHFREDMDKDFREENSSFSNEWNEELNESQKQIGQANPKELEEEKEDDLDDEKDESKSEYEYYYVDQDSEEKEKKPIENAKSRIEYSDQDESESESKSTNSITHSGPKTSSIDYHEKTESSYRQDSSNMGKAEVEDISESGLEEASELYEQESGENEDESESDSREQISSKSKVDSHLGSKQASKMTYKTKIVSGNIRDGEEHKTDQSTKDMNSFRSFKIKKNRGKTDDEHLSLVTFDEGKEKQGASMHPSFRSLSGSRPDKTKNGRKTEKDDSFMTLIKLDQIEDNLRSIEDRLKAETSSAKKLSKRSASSKKYSSSDNSIEGDYAVTSQQFSYEDDGTCMIFNTKDKSDELFKCEEGHSDYEIEVGQLHNCWFM